MVDINNFVQSPFNKSRKDKFLLILNVPTALRNISSKFNSSTNSIITDSLQFSVYGSVVPDIRVPSASVRYGGQTFAQTSFAREPYPPMTVNFTIDNQFNNYWVIYTWLNLLNNEKAGTFDQSSLLPEIKTHPNGNQPLYAYKTNISIFALDEYNNRTVEFLYTDAFPTTLGGISYSYRDEGEIETNFTFEYSQLLVKLVNAVEIS
jgi:hypothetical protein